MAANTPSTHSGWRRTEFSVHALAALMSPTFFTARMHDRSSEVKGIKGQVLTIPQMSELSDNPVGDNGEVNPQSPPALTQTLTIDQYREASMLFRDDYDLQTVVGAAKWGPALGLALRKRMETYFLSLETGIGSSYRTNVAGSITEGVLWALVATAVTNRWPEGKRHLLVSAGQMAAMAAVDTFKNVQFIGNGNMPMTSGVIKTLAGFEFGVSDLVRRRSISGTTRTVNMAWTSGEQGAFCKGIQQAVKMKKESQQLAELVMASCLYGGALQRTEAVQTLDTTNA